MNLKEAATSLNWGREQIKTAIEQGVATPVGKQQIKLAAVRLENDFDISEVNLDQFLNSFEMEEPGRYPPVSVRRNLLVESSYKCGICRSDAPLQFHHILDWALLKHHDPKHMLAVCGTCHDKISHGQIDTHAQYEFKTKHSGLTPESGPQPGKQPDCKSDRVIDVSDEEKVVWILPRGFLLLEDITYDSRPDWAVVIDYYSDDNFLTQE